MQTVILNNGVDMPILGFGVFQIPPEQTEQAVTDALAAGYRLLDTAAAYLNEEAVGRAIENSGIPREELFVTTKVWIQDAGEENTRRAFETSLGKLGLDHLDLYLIHQPFGDVHGSWRAMENLHREGHIRAIGVANFHPDRLVDLIVNNDVTPAVNQIETHPFFQRATDQEVMREHGVQIQSWGGVRRRPQQPVHSPGPERDRRQARQVRGTGRAPLALPARHCRDPQVGARRPHGGEHRRLRLRAHGRSDGVHRRPGHRQVSLLRPP